MTSNFPPDQMYIAEDGAIGLLYPSVFEMEDACNYAFPPHFTLDRIELLHVMELRVERIRDGVIKVTLLDTAIDFDDGELQWTGNRLCIPAPRPPEKGVLFRADGERWRVLTIEHLPEIDVPPDVYLAALLLE